MQAGNPQAATQAGAALMQSVNAREAGGAGGAGSTLGALGAAAAVQMREDVLTLVSSAAAASTPTPAAVGQTAAVVEAVGEVAGQVSERAATQASQLVDRVVNTSLGMEAPLADGTSVAVVRTISSLFAAVELLTAAEGGESTAATSAASSIASGAAVVAAADNHDKVGPAPQPPPPPAALYSGLRDTLGSLGHAMLKGAVAGEAP